MPDSVSIFAPLAMAGILPLGLMFDRILERHRAVLATVLVAFLFLPSVEYDLSGLLKLNRNTAIFLAVLPGLLWRDLGTLKNLRPTLFDAPVLMWCFVPILSSYVNGLGLYDGLSATFYRSLAWGGPYLLGRLHIRSKEQFLDLARAIVLGAIVYLPLCVWEIRMSPDLHQRLYGFFQHDFIQTIRGSFYRPTVFLQHGLMVGMWLAAALLSAWALFRSGMGMRVFGFPASWTVVVIGMVFLAAQSFGAVLLGTLALTVFIWCEKKMTLWPWYLLMAIPLFWVGFRLMDVPIAQPAVNAIQSISEERAHSLEFRLRAEETIIDHSLQQPWLGWGSWGRNMTVTSDLGRTEVVIDGMWVIALSQNGLLGLLALLALQLLPVWITVRRFSPNTWAAHPEHQAIAGLGCILAAAAIDNLMNAMTNPVFLLTTGALIGLKGKRSNGVLESHAPPSPTWESTRILSPTSTQDTQ